MANVQTQIRIDENIKKQATEIFANLGIDMTAAVNMFLRQVVICKGLPFPVRLPDSSIVVDTDASKFESTDARLNAYKSMLRNIENK